MTTTTVLDSNASSQEITTTNSSWTEALSVYLGGYGAPAVGVGQFRAVCLNLSTGDCAAFQNPVAFQYDGTDGRMVGVSLPSSIILTKDLPLALIDTRIVFDGTDVKFEVKGKASTTLNWFVAFSPGMILAQQ